MDPWRGKPYPLNTIHFVAGVRGSTWLGHSTAKCLHFPPDYEYVAPHRVLPSVPLEGVPQRAFLHDVVLIVLREGSIILFPWKSTEPRATVLTFHWCMHLTQLTGVIC